MPERAFPPRSRSSAWASTVFPAPVSPVIAVRPSPGRSSPRSIRSRFSMRSSSSTVQVYQRAPTEPPGRDELVGEASELVAQPVVEARARQLRQLRAARLEADGHAVFAREHADLAAVRGHL